MHDAEEPGMTTEIRCDSLDSLFACAPSVIGTDGLARRRQSEPPEAVVARQVLRAYCGRNPFDLKGAAERAGASGEAVAELVAEGMRIWNEVHGAFKLPQVGRASNVILHPPSGRDVGLSGSLDVLSPVLNDKQEPVRHKVVFLHWHTKDITEGWRREMEGYALALWTIMGKPDDAEIVGVIGFLRNRYYRTVKYDGADLGEFEASLIRRIDQQPVFEPGRQCVVCPLFATCGARHTMVESVLKLAMQGCDGKGVADSAKRLQGVTPETRNDPEVVAAVSELIFWSRVLRQHADFIRDVLTETVERVGPITLESGLSLAMRAYKQEVIDPTRALRVLRKHLSDAEIVGASRPSTLLLLAAKAGNYSRSERDDAMKQMMDDLRAAGAVTVATQRRLEEVDLAQESDGEQGSKQDVRAGSRDDRPAGSASGGA
jgi:hypothetical protein